MMALVLHKLGDGRRIPRSALMDVMRHAPSPDASNAPVMAAMRWPRGCSDTGAGADVGAGDAATGCVGPGGGVGAFGDFFAPPIYFMA
jgi:hypothetical protein